MSRTSVQATGIALFLFIPVVLYLFVRHPEPVGASLLGGVVLMVGHRFLALPYFERNHGRKCIWCNRWLGDGAADIERFEVGAGDRAVGFVACPGHAQPARRFFVWTERWRLPLRAGIGLPLLALLGALALAALGRPAPLPLVTEIFRLVIGITVHVAALGPFVPAPADPSPRAVFPIHNFALLGVRGILWIFRLVGLWWIVAAGLALARQAGS